MQTARHTRKASRPSPSSLPPALASLLLLLCLMATLPAAPSGAQEAPAQTDGEQQPAPTGTEDSGAPSPTADLTASRSSLGPLPVARADEYTVAQDKTRVVTAPGVLRNDSKRRPLLAKFVLGVEYGQLTLGKKGGFSYTPDENFRGTDYFKYRACERAHPSRCSRAVAVKLTVQGDAPVAIADSYKARKNHSKTISAPGVLKNDTDANADELRVISYTQPRRGGVIVGTGGRVRFIPDRNFTGKTSFTYWIGDATGLRDSAVVTFRVLR